MASSFRRGDGAGHEDKPVIFSIVPIEVWLDKRLRLEMVRVLGALMSFRGKNTNVVWPSRKRIAERCGMSPAKVSEATSDLVRLGWLKKDGRGGFSKATRYTITVPDIIPESGTVPDSGTVPEKGRSGVSESGTRMRVPDSGTGIELTENQSTEQTMGCPVCPVEDVMEAYHRLMPNNPRCKFLTDARRSAIRARWEEAAKLSCAPFGYADPQAGLAAWERFFAVCNESEFLTGRVKPSPGRTTFVADIDFLFSPRGFVNCLENKYHREVA